LLLAIGLGIVLFLGELWVDGQNSQPENAFAHMKRIELALADVDPVTDFVDTRTIRLESLNNQMFNTYFDPIIKSHEFQFGVFVYKDGSLLKDVYPDRELFETVRLLEKRSDKWSKLEAKYPVNIVDGGIGTVVIEYYYRKI